MLSSSVYDIRDDGNGNLRDFKNSGEHVGNVFYAQGIAVITNDEYATPDCNRLNTEDYYDIQTQNYQVICIPTGSYVDTCNYLNTQDNYDMLTQNYADICIPTGSFVDDFNYLDTQDYEDIQTQAYGDILT